MINYSNIDYALGNVVLTLRIRQALDRNAINWKQASPGVKTTSRHINNIRDKEASPNTFSGPHFRRLLSVLLSKYNRQFTAKKNLTIHMIFCICSIGWIYILDKPKATRLPASWSFEVLQKLDTYKITRGPKITNITSSPVCIVYDKHNYLSDTLYTIQVETPCGC